MILPWIRIMFFLVFVALISWMPNEIGIVCHYPSFSLSFLFSLLFALIPLNQNHILYTAVCMIVFQPEVLLFVKYMVFNMQCAHNVLIESYCTHVHNHYNKFASLNVKWKGRARWILSKKIYSHFVHVCVDISSSKCMSSIIVICRLLNQLILNVKLKTRWRVLHIRSRILNQHILNCTFCISSFSVLLFLPLPLVSLSPSLAFHIILTYKYDTNHCVLNVWWSFCWPIHLIDGSYCSRTYTCTPHQRSWRIKIKFKPKKFSIGNLLLFIEFSTKSTCRRSNYTRRIFCFLLHNILKCCCFHEILHCDRRSLTCANAKFLCEWLVAIVILNCTATISPTCMTHTETHTHTHMYIALFS